MAATATSFAPSGLWYFFNIPIPWAYALGYVLPPLTGLKNDPEGWSRNRHIASSFMALPG